ncbi:MAG: HPr family phosphocarrier protein [Actinomycetaceae bacterium]|nr:HPr family phosphocarrier protein [Actinomycetaceae bacterium]
MASKTVMITASVGLHARPAAVVASAAGQFDAGVTLRYGDKSADAASVLEIMGLGAMHGAEVTIESDDPAAVERIAALVGSDLDA